MNNPYASFGSFIKQMRLISHVGTQADLSELLDIPRGVYSLIETGRRRMPIAKIKRFIKITGCSQYTQIVLLRMAVSAEIKGAGFSPNEIRAVVGVE